MSTLRLLTHSRRMLRRYPARGVLTAAGSLVGVAALTVVLSLAGAANQRVVDTVDQLFGGSSVMIAAGGTHILGGPRPDVARLTIDDVETVVAEVPGIAAWDPQLAMPRATVRAGDLARTARVLGQSERSREVWNRDVQRGTYFDAQHVATAARVALIGPSLARGLFGSDDPIGGQVLVDAVPFQIIGVLQQFGTDIHGMDRDNELVVPITTLQRRVLNLDTIVQAKLLVGDPESVGSVARQIGLALRARHGIPDGRPDDFTVMTADEVQQMASMVRRILVLYLPLIAIACVVAAGAIAAALMLASVTERTGEIGVRRAVGALPGHIAVQFVAETALTIAAGGIAGVVVGYVLSAGAAAHLHLTNGFSWGAAAAGVTLSIAIGVAAGLLPARRAARMRPVDALR